MIASAPHLVATTRLPLPKLTEPASIPAVRPGGLDERGTGRAPLVQPVEVHEKLGLRLLPATVRHQLRALVTGDGGGGHAAVRSDTRSRTIRKASMRSSSIAASAVAKGFGFLALLDQEEIEGLPYRLCVTQQHLWPGPVPCLLELDEVLASNPTHAITDRIVGQAAVLAALLDSGGNEAERGELDAGAQLFDLDRGLHTSRIFTT